MVEEIPLTNFGLIAVSVTILLYQLNRFNKSEKPLRQHAPIFYNIHTRDEEGQKSYKMDDEKYRRKYNVDRVIYYITYSFPVTITILSIIYSSDLSIYIPLLVAAGVSTGLMECLIKIQNEERKQMGFL